ncbi:STAS domain-containing protein [Streptomycetaceae bacterium NBC_01309]
MTDPRRVREKRTVRSRVSALAPRGELDETATAALRAEAFARIAEGRPDLVVDLSGVTFCDACGLSALIGIRRRALEAGGSLRLAAVPSDLDRLLTRTGLRDFLTAHPTVDDAVSALAAKRTTQPPKRPGTNRMRRTAPAGAPRETGR